jgi:RNA recognition motif-containing protein
MAKKLYVGNLPYSFADSDLQSLFSECGNVTSAQVIMDRASGRSKGFGFVEMSSDSEAEQAISRFNGKENNGRPLTVNEARPMVPREQRSGAGSGGFGGGRDRF